MISEAPHVFSVGEVNQRVRALLRDDPGLAGLTVRGEISNWRRQSASGHCYFRLKDASGELSAVMFSRQAERLTFNPADGMAVRAAGRIDVYVERGQYQLYVEGLEHDGAGALFEAYEKLRARLGQEGLFDPARKRPLPPWPKRVAVITSPSGAARQDMVRILRQRWPAVAVLLVPAVVQGREAAASLVAALAAANQVGGVDVILFGRGGGSIEDLWAFNEEPVVRAVASSGVPVISAVGHETDTTLTDFAADLRAATPTHAAQLAVPDHEQMTERLEEAGSRLARLLAARVQDGWSRLNQLTQRRVLAAPGAALDQPRQRLDDLADRLDRAGGRHVERAATMLDRQSAMLDALSPQRVLDRGYAVLVRRSDGRVVQCPDDLPAGEEARARLARGALTVRSEGE